jgi:methionyl-tRNA formyltransferase
LKKPISCKQAEPLKSQNLVIDALKQYRVIFAGTPDFAASALQALLNSRHEVIAVYTQPDRPAGRGQNLLASPVKKLALENQLPLQQPEHFKNPDAVKTLAAYQADIMVVAAYGLILPSTVLQIPTYGCINIHASLLPRWRGAAPIQRAILAGDIQTGITIMKMAEGLDTGDMLLKKSLVISAQDTGNSLHDKLAVTGGIALIEALDHLDTYLKQACPQHEAEACYAKKINKQEAKINWSENVEQLDRQIRAFNSWPVAFSLLDEKVIRIWEADFKKTAHKHKPGEICKHDNKNIWVAAKDGFLILKTLQLPGGKPLASKDLLNSKQSLFEAGRCFES